MITMKKPLAISLCVGMAGALCLSGGASAQQAAFTNAPVDVFAGPAPDYPVVSQLPQGLQVTVYGCVAGYSWCDVAVPNLRGWIDASALSYPYHGSNVPIVRMARRSACRSSRSPWAIIGAIITAGNRGITIRGDGSIMRRLVRARARVPAMVGIRRRSRMVRILRGLPAAMKVMQAARPGRLKATTGTRLDPA